jgi:D-amino-acid dehydrogenase
MRVVVVGAGVVGLCCALELQRAGAEVVVIDRGDVGGGASHGNTGWVSPSFTYPLPAPGVVRMGLRALVRGGGPLVIHPALDPGFVRWLWQFRRSSTRACWERGVQALLALNERTIELLGEYESIGIPFELHRSGLLVVARTRDGLAPYAAIFDELAALGYRGAIAALSAEAAGALEPALDRRVVTGGLHARVDCHVRPESLTAGLASWLRAHGVEIRLGVEARSLGPGGRVATTAGPLDADRVVLAAGLASRGLAARIGVRLRLEGGKGYSLTLTGEGARPRQALYLAEAKVGVSSYRDAVRVAGVFELGRSDTEANARRIDAMLETVRPYFVDWHPVRSEDSVAWAGLRPTSPDGLPLIGPAPANPSVVLATGHGMLGVTLAPATAALVAPLVLDGRLDPALVPFDPARRV